MSKTPSGDDSRLDLDLKLVVNEDHPSSDVDNPLNLSLEPTPRNESHHVYFRILGYVVTLVMHTWNLAYMRRTVNEAKVNSMYYFDNAGMIVYKTVYDRYLSTSNASLQIWYAYLGLLCDIIILYNRKKKNYELPLMLRTGRELMFSGLVWPSTLVVFIVFWTLFLYERSLIYPVYMDKMITTTSNHILHTAILPVVLWEVVFRSWREPAYHARNIIMLTYRIIAYGVVVHMTQYELGVWMYPILDEVYGTVHFYLLHVYVAMLAYITDIHSAMEAEQLHSRQNGRQRDKSHITNILRYQWRR